MRTSSPPSSGQIIAGKYRVEHTLGEGGMGLVLSAWHLGLDQRVAIKLLHGHMLQEDSALARFQREARAAARIRSEYVCRVLDTGILDDGTPYLVMEHLEGLDLSDELNQRGRFEIGAATQLVRQACEAISEANAAGIVHRDLKPANLFLTQRTDGTPAVKVLDFGVSKTLDVDSKQLSLTKTSSLIGSPLYMSPEQLHSSKDVDARTDVWALGTILYELVTGRTPFTGETIPQLVNAVLHGQPPTLDSLAIRAPGGFEAVVLKALAKERDRRYQSAKELSDALLPYSPEAAGKVSGTLPSGRISSPERVGAASSPAVVPQTISIDQARPVYAEAARGQPQGTSSRAGSSSAGSSQEPAPRPPQSPLRYALIGALFVLLAGLLAWLTHRKESAIDVAGPAVNGAEMLAPPTLPVQPTPPKQDAPVDEKASAADQAETQLAQPVAAEDATPTETKPQAIEPEKPTTSRSRSRDTEASSHAASKRVEPSAPAPEPATKPAPAALPQPSNTDSLPNFGGRR